MLIEYGCGYWKRRQSYDTLTIATRGSTCATSETDEKNAPKIVLLYLDGEQPPYCLSTYCSYQLLIERHFAYGMTFARLCKIRCKLFLSQAT